jgi:hypothetical protein
LRTPKRRAVAGINCINPWAPLGKGIGIVIAFIMITECTSSGSTS